MIPEAETLVRFLDGAGPLIEGAPRPDNQSDADSVLAAVHRMDGALGGLHDEVAGCFGQIDDCGRCVDCGRLVVPGMWRAHKEGPGCLYAIPLVSTVVWLVHYREAIPVLGNLIWRHRRRSAPSSPAGIAAPTGDNGGAS